MINELMVGNWVQKKTPFTGEKYVKVNNIGLEEINSDFRPLRYDEIEPIPITTHLLDEIDEFELLHKSKYSITYDFKANHSFSYEFDLVDKEQWMEYRGKRIDVEYLHEIQSIFRLLTKEDLDINL